MSEVEETYFCKNPFMEIEKEIKQTAFRNEYQKVALNLVFSSNWVLEKIRLIIEKEGITYQQFNILRILQKSPSPLSTQQIRERMLDKMSDTSRIVDRMVVKGFVDKKLCTYDKRLVDITISAKGHELLARLEKVNKEIDAIACSLTTEEAAALNKLLDKLREND